MSILILNIGFNTMGLKDVLEANKIPLPADFDERFNLVILGLRRDPKFNTELEKFKNKQDGGLKIPAFAKGLKANIPATANASASLAPPMSLDSEDWMGPRIKWFLDTITSPYVRVMLRGLFIVIFFVSYLEAIPVFGNILSVALDIMVTGGKIITKSVQKQIPFFMGLIPIPYASLIGLIMAAIYGAMVWPMIAMVAFSRQDFTSAIESFLRAIPPPAGDMIADLFLEGNRFVAKMEAKRQKLAYSIASAINTVATVIEDISNRLNSGLSNVSAQVTRASQMKDRALNQIQSSAEQVVDTPPAPSNTPMQPITTAFNEVKQPNPKALSSNMNLLSSKIKQAAKPRASFAPTPVGRGLRKGLSTRRHIGNKWKKTLRIKSEMH
jgi:hypothetical protein